MRRPDPEAEAFWRNLKLEAESCEWIEFVNSLHSYFLSYSDFHIRKVLSWAMFMDEPKKRVEKENFEDFVDRFGPFELCLERSTNSLFDSNGNPFPWFHGFANRNESKKRVLNEGIPGSFLIRYSSSESTCFSMVYLIQDVRNPIWESLITNTGERGYSAGISGEFWMNISTLIEHYQSIKILGLPVPRNASVVSASLIESMSISEVKAAASDSNHIEDTENRCSVPIRVPPPASSSRNSRSDIICNKMLIEISDLTSKATDESRPPESQHNARSTALDLIDNFVRSIPEFTRNSALDPMTLCRVLKYEGALLIRNEPEAGVRSYKRAILIMEDYLHLLQEEEKPTNNILSDLWVIYLTLGMHYLNAGNFSKALDHYAMSMAYDTNKASRLNTAQKWSKHPNFNEALQHSVNQLDLEKMFDEGRGKVTVAAKLERTHRGSSGMSTILASYEDVLLLFERALRNARCLIGTEADRGSEASVLEARALGNLAAINQKIASIHSDPSMYDQKMSTAADQYKLSAKLFANEGDTEKEYKMLEKYLKTCQILQRWSKAATCVELMLDKARSSAEVAKLNEEKEAIKEKLSLFVPKT